MLPTISPPGEAPKTTGLAGVFNFHGGASIAHTRTLAENDDTLFNHGVAVSEHQRYRTIEADVVSQYQARGLGDKIEDMSVGTLRGIVNLHSKVTAIHEVAEAARQDLRGIAERSIAGFNAKMDRRFGHS